MTKQMWALKHRPKIIEDYIFSDSNRKDLIEKYVKEGNIPHLLLHGKRGTGKTSLAYMLKNLLHIEDIDFLKINAADENSVETVRTKVKNFVSTYSMSDFKIVFLDEAERLTESAQDTLKSMMEDYGDNARFIVTVNKIHKIIPELQSRLTPLEFKSLDQEEMMLKAAKILAKEKIKTTCNLLEEYVTFSDNDFRKLLNLLQKNIKDGVLQPLTIEDQHYEIKAKSLLFLGEKDWESARKLLCNSLSDDEFEDMYRFYYENIHELDNFPLGSNNWKKAILIISDYLYKNEFVADKEINFVACLIKITEVIV